MASARRKKVRVSPPTGTSAAAAVAAPAPAPAPDVRAGRAVNVTVGDADVLECGVCFLPLRPPIFQCEVGHLVCSACRDKMEATGNGNCHVCGVATRGYRRCHAMEQLVDCTTVPCPYAAHGCNTTPPYHGLESHRRVCPHAPCHCPGASCGFVGSIPALLDHFAAVHKWPCITKSKALARQTLCRIPLHLGFNFLVLANDVDGDDDGDQAGDVTCSVPSLFLLNVTHHEGIGRAISMFCIRPHGNAVIVTCELDFSRCCGPPCQLNSHNQSSHFYAVCTDLSNGLPSRGCFQLIVPHTILVDDDDRLFTDVKARINIF